MELFTSYAQENYAEARELVDILVAGGNTVWFDDQLLPGQDWKQELGQEIADCDAFVYALSQAAVTSEWCQWEFATAVRLQKAIIPVLLEPDLALPSPLARLQYADFTQGTTPIEVAKLMGALLFLQKVPLVQSPDLPDDPKGVPSRAWASVGHWTDMIVKPSHEPQNETEEIL